MDENCNSLDGFVFKVKGVKETDGITETTIEIVYSSKEGRLYRG